MPRNKLPAPVNLPQDVIDVFMEACDTADMTVLRQKIEMHPGIVNLKDEDGLPALHRAVSWAKTEVVGLLLERGADPAATDTQGQTADILAARLGYETIAALILRTGNKYRQEEHQAALRRQSDEMCKVLKSFSQGLEKPVKARHPARFTKTP